MIISVTGHRPPSMPCGYREHHPWARGVKDALYAYLDKHRPSILWSGMAIGWDTWCADAALGLGIRLGCMLPCHGQEDRWPPKAKMRYHNILSHAAEIRYTVDGPYAKDCMLLRNLDLIAQLRNPEDHLLALYNGQNFGGTRHTVMAAMDRHIKVVNLWPKDTHNA